MLPYATPKYATSRFAEYRDRAERVPGQLAVGLVAL